MKNETEMKIEVWIGIVDYFENETLANHYQRVYNYILINMVEKNKEEALSALLDLVHFTFQNKHLEEFVKRYEERFMQEGKRLLDAKKTV